MPTMYLDHDPTRLEIKAGQLNPICEDCILQGTACKGTTCQSWTGCARKPWNPSAQFDTIGANSAHGLKLARLAQAVALTRKASSSNPITIFYSDAVDAIKAQPRKPGEPLSTPSTYAYITTTSKPLSAAEIVKAIDFMVELSQELPF